MGDETVLIGLIETYSLAILLPLAVVEGPVVSILAGYLASIGLVSPGLSYLCLVLADLFGDGLLYLIGRRSRRIAPDGMLARLGVTRRRLAWMVRRFRRDGMRYLVLGKLTHSAGFAVLIAAGAARLPPLRFILVNLAATLPKTLVLLGLGWAFGAAWQRVDVWIFRTGLGIFAALALYLLFRFWTRQREPR